jgi:LuxR family maltose regulon positive regulatory protein
MMIEILILQAFALQGKKDSDEALGKLTQALTLAEPGGFIRTFADEGPPLAGLLYEALDRGITRGSAPEYVRRLLAAFSPVATAYPAPQSHQFPIPVAKGRGQSHTSSPLIESLSDREVEVLQLISEGLTNRQIAERLYLSLNTVKAHTRNIYGKLDVHSRVQAVSRARELAILPPV